MHPSDLTNVAIQAALKAGHLLKRGFGTSYEIKSKSNKHDLVTFFDKQSEEHIFTTIRSHFPDHSFLAEESGSIETPSPVLWIIDPLDGTMNFAHNIPIFTVSIAAAIEKNIVCGVIYQPMTEELFVAEKGKGAYLNGTKLSVSSEKKLDHGLMATGFPPNVNDDPKKCIEVFSHMTRLGLPIRRLGSAALDLAYLAAGRFDAYWEVSLHAWDIAAGKLIVEEAGGKVTHYDGTPHRVFCYDTVLASNGHLHQHMIKELKSER